MFGFKKYIKNFLQMSVRYSQTFIPGWETLMKINPYMESLEQVHCFQELLRLNEDKRL